MLQPQRVRVDLGDRAYDIVIGSGVLARAESYQGLPSGRSCAIVTNETVGPLLADRLAAMLAPVYPDLHVITLPDGEAHKNWSTLQRIFDALLEARCDRQTTIFALGGGVVGDMAGFAAACYMRGVPYVQVPTTLLAQVDSSVGGKTAVNHPLGKNMLGVFNQPVRVIADIDTLASLPEREWIAGLAEVVKYGAIADHDFLEWIESHADDLVARDKAATQYAVARSCVIKATIVARDEREGGLRAILNFGHTFAHAIETGMGYGSWLHGEAVGCGMAMGADLSRRLGLIDDAHARRIAGLVERIGLPTRAPPLGIERYLELMRIDKKAAAGEMRFVLVEGPGHAIVQAVAEGEVVRTVTHFGGAGSDTASQ